MKFAILVAGGMLLAGCATKYQPEGFTGGFTELQLSADTYRISVRGNGYTSTQRAEEIALLRAADLATQKGFQRFVLLGGGVRQESAGTTPVVANRIGNSVYFSGGDEISKPAGTIMIRLVAPNDPAYATALDAKLIDAQLRKKLTE